MTAIRVDRAGVVLGGRQIIAGVDLEVRSGAWLGLIGPNGAGKTTLLRAIIQAVPTSGSIALDGRPVDTMSRRELARMVATVPQRPVLPSGMTVVDYVLLGRAPHVPYWGTEASGDLAAASDAMRALDLDSLAGRPLGQLSGGEQQRVLLARALAQDAPVLLLDEPIASLDVGHQQLVLELVESLRRSRGLTVVSALHDLTLAAQFCDRLALLAGGRLVAEGLGAEVLTEASIREHYGADVRVLEDGDSVVVIPLRDSRRHADRGTMPR